MRARLRQLLTITSFFVAALAAGPAEAAPPGAPSGPARSSSQFTLRREEAGGAEGSTARKRARAGDCAGALPAFDAAIRVTIEPTLRRDRGLCHEKLGSPYPAMDDYRAYLTASPDAPDAEQIRERLARLEEEAGTGGPADQAVRDRGDDSKAFQGSGQVSASMGGGSASASSKSTSAEPLGPRPGETARDYDYYRSQEKLAEQADGSPLRHGTGFIAGPFLSLPRYFLGEGASKDMGYSVGATLRYAWSPTLSFISELGFAGVGESGQNTSFSGPLLFAGVELRIPLDTWATNQLVLGFGPGFERYTVSGTRAGINIWEGRARFGYRHVFGPAVGLEFLADGGPAYFHPTDSAADGRLLGLIGGSCALVVGF